MSHFFSYFGPGYFFELLWPRYLVASCMVALPFIYCLRRLSDSHTLTTCTRYTARARFPPLVCVSNTYVRSREENSLSTCRGLLLQGSNCDLEFCKHTHTSTSFALRLIGFYIRNNSHSAGRAVCPIVCFHSKGRCTGCVCVCLYRSLISSLLSATGPFILFFPSQPVSHTLVFSPSIAFSD